MNMLKKLGIWFRRQSLARKLTTTALITSGVTLLAACFVFAAYDYINQPKGRAWPPGLHFERPLIAFGVVLGLCTLALGLARAHRKALVALCLAAVAFTYFLLDDFMVKVTPFCESSTVKVRCTPASSA